MLTMKDVESIPRSFGTERFYLAPWWLLTPMVQELVYPETTEAAPIDPVGVALTIGQQGTMTLTGVDDERCDVVYPNDNTFWIDLHSKLERLTRRAEVLRRRTWAQTADGAIEHYYRSKARGSRITLRDVAAISGFSEAYLRKRKVEYDRAGKWGSKASR